MRVLKKILLWLLLVAVLAALIVGGAVAWFYYNTDPEAFDAPAVTAGGTALAVNGYEWNAPVMGGVLFKSASRHAGNAGSGHLGAGLAGYNTARGPAHASCGEGSIWQCAAGRK